MFRSGRKVSWATKQSAASIFTWVFYGLALLACITWLLLDCPRLEPLVVIFALITAGLGSYSQFRVFPMLERCTHLSALMHELYKNMSIYREHYTDVPNEERRLIFLPQYHVSAAEFCISQGVLDPQDDRELFNKLHDFHDRVRQVNSRLAIEESKMMTRAMKKVVKEQIYQAMVNGKAMRSIWNGMNELYTLLREKKYVDLHGVKADTALFPDRE